MSRGPQLFDHEVEHVTLVVHRQDPRHTLHPLTARHHVDPDRPRVEPAPGRTAATGCTMADVDHETGLGRDLVETLLRWQDAGGVWRVVATTSGRVTVALLRCDGGEEVERLTTADARTLQFIAGRAGSDD